MLALCEWSTFNNTTVRGGSSTFLVIVLLFHHWYLNTASPAGLMPVVLIHQSIMDTSAHDLIDQIPSDLDHHMTGYSPISMSIFILWTSLRHRVCLQDSDVDIFYNVCVLTFSLLKTHPTEMRGA